MTRSCCRLWVSWVCEHLLVVIIVIAIPATYTGVWSTSIREVENVQSVSGTFRYIGNSIISTALYQINTAAGSFVLPYCVIGQGQAGVITHLYVYVVVDLPVVLQVWRPRTDTGSEVSRSFTLVGEHQLRYEDAPALVEVAFESGEYIFVEEGDMLGFHNPQNHGPIGFDVDLSMQNTFIHRSTVDLGQSAEFAFEAVPYVYQLAAIVDTEDTKEQYGSRYSVTPRTDYVTREVDLDPLISLSPNEYLLQQSLRPTTLAMTNHDGQTYIIPTLCSQHVAKVTGLYAYVINTGTVTYQIWRPVSGARALDYSVVEEIEVQAERGATFLRTRLDGASRINIEPGDCLGFTNHGERGVVGYAFEDVDLLITNTQTDDVITYNNVTSFVSLLIPYKFALGFSYVLGDDDNTTVTSTQLPRDDEHFLSTDKPQGEESGEQREGQVTESPGDLRSEKSKGSFRRWLENPDTLLIFLIWLIAVSVLLLLLCVYLCIRSIRRKNSDYNYSGASGGQYHHHAAPPGSLTVNVAPSNGNSGGGEYDRFTNSTTSNKNTNNNNSNNNNSKSNNSDTKWQRDDMDEDNRAMDYYSDKIIDTYMSRGSNGHSSATSTDPSVQRDRF